MVFFPRVMQPVSMSWLIASFEDDKSSLRTWAYGVGFVLSTWIGSLLAHKQHFDSIHIGLRKAIAISSVIYRKATKTLKGSNTVGHSVNMLSNDVIRLEMACHYMHFIWGSPVHLLIVLGITWHRMGPSTIAGAMILLIFACSQGKKQLAFV